MPIALATNVLRSMPPTALLLCCWHSYFPASVLAPAAARGVFGSAVSGVGLASAAVGAAAAASAFHGSAAVGSDGVVHGSAPWAGGAPCPPHGSLPDGACAGDGEGSADALGFLVSFEQAMSANDNNNVFDNGSIITELTTSRRTEAASRDWTTADFRVASAMEARAGLVPASVFKTDEALREQRLGGFDSHAPPPLHRGILGEMRVALALLLAAAACGVHTDPPPTVAQTCAADADCAFGVCARTHECLAPSDVQKVQVLWTIAGKVADDSTCTYDPDIEVELKTEVETNVGETATFGPMACSLGKFTVDKLPVRFWIAGVTTRGTGMWVPFDATGTARIDLPY